MNTKNMKLFLAITLLVGLPASFAAGKWYWSSQSFVHTVVVDGNIDAKCNFIPAEALAGAPSYNSIETCDNLIQLVEDGDYYLWFILSPDSDATDVYIRVMVSPPEGGSCTATVETQTYNVGSGSVAPVLVDNINCDGVDSVQIERGGDPQWILGSTFGSEYRMIRVKLMFDNSMLSAGSYEYFCRVEIGDSV